MNKKECHYCQKAFENKVNYWPLGNNASLLERATVVFYRAMFVINQIVSRLAEKSASVSTLAWSHVASCQICIEVGKMNDPERIHDT